MPLGRGPSISGPDEIARALDLTDTQKIRMKEIYANQTKRWKDMQDVPGPDGVPPNAYMAEHQEAYEKAMDERDGPAIMAAMQKLGVWQEWVIPGTEETYSEASARYLREAEEEFVEILTAKQRELWADKAYMGRFAKPLNVQGGAQVVESWTVTKHSPGK